MNDIVDNPITRRLNSLIRKGLKKKNGVSLKLILDELDYYERLIPTLIEINTALEGFTGRIERKKNDLKLIQDNKVQDKLVLGEEEYSFICSRI